MADAVAGHARTEDLLCWKSEAVTTTAKSAPADLPFNDNNSPDLAH